MPFAATQATREAPAPIIVPNVTLEFHTKAQAEAFMDGLNYASDHRVTILGTRVHPHGRTEVHLLDERT